LSSPRWLAKELEPKQNLFPDHLSSILHGALVGAGSFPWVLPCSCWSPLTGQKSFNTQNYVQHVNYPPYKTGPTLFFPCWLMRQPAAPPSTTKTKVKRESKGPTDNTSNALFKSP